MKILFYGQNGLLGKEFIRLNELLNNINLGNQITTGISNINNYDWVDREIKATKPDVIINFAGLIDYNLKNSRNILMNNLVGPLNILNHSNNIPVICLGSISSIEYNKNIYALSKYCLDILTKQYKNLFVVRLPGIFASKRKEGAIYNFYKKCLNNEKIIIDSDLKSWNCLYSSSAIDTILTNLEKIITGNKIKNIGYFGFHNLADVAILMKIESNSKSDIIIENNTDKFNMAELDGDYIQSMSNLREDIIRYVDLCNR